MKSYTCGCDVQCYTALYPVARVVNKMVCPTHGAPKAAHKGTLRAERNDANEMTACEEMRRDGLSPAARVRVAMEAAEMPSLGALDWNRRHDAVSAAPE